MDNKKTYEKFLGKRISDRTWARDKALMKGYGLSISKENLKKFADVKNQSLKFSIPISKSIKFFLDLNIDKPIRGIDIWHKLTDTLTDKPHRTTIRRWFPNGYQLERIYKPEEISQIILHAFIHRLRNEKNGTRKKEHRSYQISA